MIPLQINMHAKAAPPAGAPAATPADTPAGDSENVPSFSNVLHGEQASMTPHQQATRTPGRPVAKADDDAAAHHASADARSTGALPAPLAVAVPVVPTTLAQRPDATPSGAVTRTVRPDNAAKSPDIQGAAAASTAAPGPAIAGRSGAPGALVTQHPADAGDNAASLQAAAHDIPVPMPRNSERPALVGSLAPAAPTRGVERGSTDTMPTPNMSKQTSGDGSKTIVPLANTATDSAQSLPPGVERSLPAATAPTLQLDRQQMHDLHARSRVEDPTAGQVTTTSTSASSDQLSGIANTVTSWKQASAPGLTSAIFAKKVLANLVGRGYSAHGAETPRVPVPSEGVSAADVQASSHDSNGRNDSKMANSHVLQMPGEQLHNAPAAEAPAGSVPTGQVTAHVHADPPSTVAGDAGDHVSPTNAAEDPGRPDGLGRANALSHPGTDTVANGQPLPPPVGSRGNVGAAYPAQEGRVVRSGRIMAATEHDSVRVQGDASTSERPAAGHAAPAQAAAATPFQHPSAALQDAMRSSESSQRDGAATALAHGMAGQRRTDDGKRDENAGNNLPVFSGHRQAADAGNAAQGADSGAGHHDAGSGAAPFAGSAGAYTAPSPAHTAAPGGSTLAQHLSPVRQQLAAQEGGNRDAAGGIAAAGRVRGQASVQVSAAATRRAELSSHRDSENTPDEAAQRTTHTPADGTAQAGTGPYAAQASALQSAGREEVHSAPAVTATERTLAPALADGILVRQAQLRTTPSSSSFRVVLQPQTLGIVTVQVERTHTGLHVTLMARQGETQALLDRHLPELVSLLRSADTGSFNVSVKPPESTAARPDTSASSQQTPLAGGMLAGGQSFGADAGGRNGQAFGQQQPASLPFEWNDGDVASGSTAPATPLTRRAASSAETHIDVQA